MKVTDSSRDFSRGLLFLAAVLWSLSGLLTKMLSVPGPMIAAYRSLFAGLFLLLFLRRPFHFERRQLILVLFFAGMNLAFVMSLTVTTAANAIFLQYTAPIWISAFCVLFWKEKLDRPSFFALAIGMVGVGVLIAGEWKTEFLGVTLGLLSGFLFAGVVLCQRWLSQANAVWLTSLEAWGSVALLLPFLFWKYPAGELLPSGPDLLVLAVYGAVQFGLPYLCFSKGIRKVSPQEAGVILLLEPVLNPVWTFLFLNERPSVSTLIGGACLLGALAFRYLAAFAAAKLTPSRRS